MSTPDTTWNELVNSHRMSVQGPNDAIPDHQPKAAVLGCADARVSPSIVFGQPAGALFEVRIAGNTASPTALASLDYAVGELGVELLIVLGHTGCGAVGAAAAGICDGHLAPVVEPICDVVRKNPGASVDELVTHNINATVNALTQHAGPTGTAAREGQLMIRGAVHDLLSGQLEPTDPQPNPEPAT